MPGGGELDRALQFSRESGFRTEFVGDRKTDMLGFGLLGGSGVTVWLGAWYLGTVAAIIGKADPRMATIIRLAIATGARRGELGALKWSDIDVEQRLS